MLRVQTWGTGEVTSAAGRGDAAREPHTNHSAVPPPRPRWPAAGSDLPPARYLRCSSH